MQSKRPYGPTILLSSRSDHGPFVTKVAPFQLTSRAPLADGVKHATEREPFLKWTRVG